jgi:hypothetical protein
MSRNKQVPNGYKKISVNVKVSLVEGLIMRARKDIITFSRALERAVKYYLEEKDGEPQSANKSEQLR